jgi:hypothetical protein
MASSILLDEKNLNGKDHSVKVLNLSAVAWSERHDHNGA